MVITFISCFFRLDFTYSIILIDKDLRAICLIVTDYTLFNHKIDYIIIIRIILSIYSLSILASRLEC